MASPLCKRYPRELMNNLGKYLGIFLLMVVAISLTTGFLAAASSIEILANNVRDKYVQEDGQFVSNFKVPDDVLAGVEELGVAVYPNFSRDVALEVDGEESSVAQVMRVFAERTQVDLAAYFEGGAPRAANEIAIDRVYAEHHNVKVGDALTLANEQFVVSGILSLSDYQALFEKNSDFVFNAQSFCVGVVTKGTFDSFDSGTLRYVYSFICDDRGLSDADRVSLEEDIVDVLVSANVVLSDFTDASTNNAIGYAASDVQGDQLMWEILLWLIVAIMAFVFVILTNSTIEEESAVIGTLLASGYRKSELVGHYLTLPMVVGIFGAAVGNVLGYTLLADPMKNLYYNSYSLPPYEAVWNPRVFMFTTVIPLVLLFVITIVGLMRKLSLSPLQFLRHEVSRTSRRKSAHLPEKMKFAGRFRLRVFLRNLPNFVTLFLGISLSSLLLIFGLCLIPCIESYANDLRASLVAEHTYMLKSPLELEGSDQERTAWKAAHELSSKVDLSAIDEDVDSIEEEAAVVAYAIGAIGNSALSVEAAPTAEVADAADAANASSAVDWAAFDLAGVEPKDIGLGDVDMGDLTVGEFLQLVSDAGDVLDDDDAHPVNTQDNDRKTIDQAEKFAATSLAMVRLGGEGYEDITVYGVQENSAYWDALDVSENKVVIGNGLADKYGISAGETFTLDDRYGTDTYTLQPCALWGSAGNMNVYMSLDAFNDLFGNDASYFNGYVSNQALNLDDVYLASDMTPSDMDKIVAQMEDSMGSMGYMMITVAVLIFIILMYLLTKTVIDHSARSISYMKVFGYRDKEINRLYVNSITGVVVVSLVACLPILFWILGLFVKLAFAEYSGNFVIAIEPGYILQDLALGVVSYAVVAFLHVRRIKRVPLALALKAQE